MNPLTNGQKVVIKNRIIRGRSWQGPYAPDQHFMKWWDKQEPEKMEKKLSKLTKIEGSLLISDAIQGNWSRVIENWKVFTK